MLTTAILVDGGFFLKRFPAVYPDLDCNDPVVVAKTMHKMALAHLYSRAGRRTAHLYRIFFYDCPPLSKRVHRPISGKAHDFSRDQTSKFRTSLHDEIRCLRKTALRLGRRDEKNAAWQINPRTLKDLIAKKIQFTDLTDDDFTFYAKQKVVDMKIGLYIASLSHKKLANQIVLIAGDSDFVPAAKQARREGIDFILDPMWNHINPDLNEHIDGLRSTCPNPSPRPVTPTFVPPDDDVDDISEQRPGQRISTALDRQGGAQNRPRHPSRRQHPFAPRLTRCS